MLAKEVKLIFTDPMVNLWVPGSQSLNLAREF
jgi:hypothetical protein